MVWLMSIERHCSLMVTTDEFNISCVGIIVYRGLYFGMYDSLKPVLLTGDLQVSVTTDEFLSTLVHNFPLVIL